MRVSLYPSLNQKKTNYSTSLQKTNITKNILAKKPGPNNVSFGSDGSLIYLVARGGLATIKNGPKNYKMNKLLFEIGKVIDNPKELNNSLPDALSALAKIPDNASKGASFHILGALMGKEKWDNIFAGMPDLVVSDLRLEAIRTLSLASDNSHVNIQSKKDFMRSLFTHGYDLDDDFFKEFKNLNENYYKNFKEEIVDTCLYSKEYESKRHNAYSSTTTEEPPKKNQFLIKNMSLVGSLDEKIHGDYLKKIYNTVLETKKYLLNSAMEDYKNGGIETCLICSDFSRHGRPVVKNEKLYDEYQYHAIVFEELFKNCKGDINQLSKYFGIDKSDLERLINERNRYLEEYKRDPWDKRD